MNIAIIGYGKMGKEIEKTATERGHSVSMIIDADNQKEIDSETFRNADVAIEFSTPETAYNNILTCMKYNVPVVSGTTGWMDKLENVKEKCNRENRTVFYASNFSLGVNLFFKLNEQLASLMDGFPQYTVKMEETHHTQKKDKPSGTAITLAEGIIRHHNNSKYWETGKTTEPGILPIESFRVDPVAGNHKIIYESDFDKIIIEHDTKSRKVFAIGAVMAAEFTKTNKGFLTMKEMLNI